MYQNFGDQYNLESNLTFFFQINSIISGYYIARLNVITPAVYNIQQGAIHHIRPKKEKHNSSKTKTKDYNIHTSEDQLIRQRNKRP